MISEALLQKKLQAVGCLSPTEEAVGPRRHYQLIQAFLAKELEEDSLIKAAFFAITAADAAPWGIGVGILVLTEEEVLYAAATEESPSLEVIAFGKEELEDVGVAYNQEETGFAGFDFKADGAHYCFVAFNKNIPKAFVEEVLLKWL